jgi:two-component system sensor histidine kinase YesM
LNQHFIYNTLNNVQYFINKGEREASLVCISRLGRLLRQWMQDTSVAAEPVSEAVSQLENYLELEQLRFSGHFSFSVSCGLPSGDAVFITPHIIFPLAEHAVGWCQKQPAGGSISIRFLEDHPFIRCTVEATAGGVSLAAGLHIVPQQNNTSRLCSVSSL